MTVRANGGRRCGGGGGGNLTLMTGTLAPGLSCVSDGCLGTVDIFGIMLGIVTGVVVGEAWPDGVINDAKDEAIDEAIDNGDTASRC